MSLIKPLAILAESRALLALAWPMVIAQLAQIGTGVVDTVMAGHYNTTDLAAIAIGYNIWLPLYLFFIGVSLGATYIIAQHAGAGRINRIRNSLPQALWLALALGLVGGPLCYGAAPVLDLLQLDATTRARSLAYLQAVAFGLPAAAVFEALRCHIQGVGIMRPFAIASVLGFLTNIPLNYALMYGRWGFPEMGAAGCGWATAFSLWLSAAVLWFCMTRAEGLGRYLPPLRLVPPRPDDIAQIVRLGLPWAVHCSWKSPFSRLLPCALPPWAMPRWRPTRSHTTCGKSSTCRWSALVLHCRFGSAMRLVPATAQGSGCRLPAACR